MQMKIFKKLVLPVLLGLSFIVSAHAYVMGFLMYSEESGLNKICYYDVLGDKYALNVKSYRICPLSHPFNIH